MLLPGAHRRRSRNGISAVHDVNTRRTQMKPSKIKPLVWAIALATLATSGTALAQKKPLRVGMTLSDIPTTTGQPNGGGEGNRMTGITLYDGLINNKLDDPKGPVTLVPGLATEWSVDPKDHNRWTFKLR